MATAGLRDSNRDTAGDFIGECSVTQSCEPCMKNNVSKTSTVFCKDCDEFLCDACKNPHTVYKAGKHDIVKCQDSKSLPAGVDMKGLEICQEHGMEIYFFCHDHSKLCCSKCVLTHRKCDRMDEIVTAFEQKRPDLQAVKQSLIKFQSEADAIIEDCKHAESGLNDSIAKISSEADAMRDRLIKLYEDAKQKLLSEAKQFQTLEVRGIGNKLDETSNVKEEINKEVSMCCSVLDRGTPAQKYIYAMKIKEKLNTIESNLNKQHCINSSSSMTVSFPREITTLLEMGNNFIKLNCDGNKTVETSGIILPSQPWPLSLELLVSVDLHKTGDDDGEPSMTGLDFLPDGRLVAVDNKNKKCIILDERLQRLGTPYKFKAHPHSVVCVSHDALCVTFGGSVCLFSLSTDNTIRLAREMITTSKFDSICCISPSQMAASTYDDPRPARVLSVDGVESDFHQLEFWNKTYEYLESKCTYVQAKNMLVLTDRLAHTVYVYDTVKGTSRVFTNEKIQEPRGACVGPGDTVLVCSTANNSIVRLSVDGDLMCTYPVDMKYPESMCVSKDGTRLAVSNTAKGARKLNVYKMSPAMS
ncbi:hypothetical protein DPMN_133589 [Dreissena polymorpha]|uniref:B box-type domain-containing protein n=1 Tax=Dreissena polymorpha TaxID=45954 RepID=A0A9D4FVU3_DREPO|nr:hypothetical protein DPMN_133589 [Dreissena polymorpha]